MAAAAAARARETRCERAGLAGCSREGLGAQRPAGRGGWGRSVRGPPPLLRSFSLGPSGRIAKFAEGERLLEGDRLSSGRGVEIRGRQSDGGRPPRPNAKLELATSGDRRKELEIPRLCEGRAVGRKALRRRRKPRRSRRRHPQRTLRIRHGFASFGRYYFAPEKKNKYKKGLDIKRRQILFSLEGGGGGGDGRGNAEQMRPEASRSPRPRLGRGRSHPSTSLAPHPRSPRPPTAPSFPVPVYLAVLGSSLYLILRDYRGLLSPGIATSQ